MKSKISGKKYIKLNIDNNYLSFGNLFRIIKEESAHSSMFLQTDLFSIIFSTYDIADSTVNNYCTGFRDINPKYKSVFRLLKEEYNTNNNALIPIVSKIISLFENNYIMADELTLDEINNNFRLKNICTRLYSISKNDTDVAISFSNELFKLLEKKDLYNFLVSVLFYVILERKQPIYIEDQINSVIEKTIYDTNISVNNIQDFISIQLNSNIWSVREIKELAKTGNPFACFEVASMEYYGIITGKPRIDEAYKYYQSAAKNNHPVANWAIGYLYYNGHIGKKSKKDMYLAFKYFNKSRKLKCSNAYNSLGLIFLNGDVPHIRKNKNFAIEMFNKAISMGNLYAYNNLGKLYEDERNFEKAFEYYIVSANRGDSWSANRIGDFYRRGVFPEKNLKKPLNIIYYPAKVLNIHYVSGQNIIWQSISMKMEILK